MRGVSRGRMTNTSGGNGKLTPGAMWQIPSMNLQGEGRRSPALWALGPTVAVLMTTSSPAQAQAQARGSAPSATPSWSSAVLVDLAASFVPVANDVPLMVGIGVRAHDVHEVWARIGYIPVGDDVGHAFGVVGYRAALRPGRVVRPVVGGYFAGLPATCGHDAQGRPSCTPDPLFIFSAMGGVRVEPVPWLGVSGLLSLGMDSYPNPFGMVELAVTFALPLS